MSLTWREVLARHGSRRGIRITDTHASLLLDFGLSPYDNARAGERILYEGEGKTGDQTPTGGNAGLLECRATGRALIVFERSSPGVWHERGQYHVTDVVYQKSKDSKRMVFVFTLEPVPNPNSESRA